jgi:hypothetical protein
MRTIAVDYTLEEYVEFNALLFEKQIRVQFGLNLAIGAILLAYAIFFSWVSDLVVAAIGIVFLIRAIFHRSMLVSAARKLHSPADSWLHIKRAVTLTQEGVRTEGHDGSLSFTPWVTVHRLIEGKLIDIIVLDSNMGIIVPRRGFPEEQAHYRFVEFAREKISAKKAGPQVATTQSPTLD